MLDVALKILGALWLLAQLIPYIILAAILLIVGVAIALGAHKESKSREKRRQSSTRRY